MDLNHLTPDQIAILKQQLAQTDTSGRSPIRARQLHDLRLLPTANDPRPTFFWSAESPREVALGNGTEFPKLLWDGETGVEITVHDAMEEAERLQDGYVRVAPASVVVDKVDALADQLAGLSEEEQKLILQAQQQSRIQALTEKLATLSPAELDRLLGNTPPAAKRGPGRPRKAVA